MNRTSVAVSIAVTALIASSCSEDPQAARARFVASGDRYMSQKNYSEAIVQYRNAVAKDGSNGEARFKLAEAYLTTGEGFSALREYVRAADLMPNDFQSQLKAGQGLLAVGQFPEAKARALAALAKQPKNIEALTLMGNALAGLKDLDGAITQIEEAIDSDPHRTYVYGNLGMLQLAKGNREAAEAAFKRAVDVEPKSGAAHLALGNFYFAGNRRAETEREFKAALEVEPKSPSANRALALFYVNTNQPTKAEPYLKAYADLVPDASPKIILADFYLANNKTKEGIAVLQELQKTKDGFVAAKLRFARLDSAAGRRPQAYQAIEEALKHEPKNEAARLEKIRFLLADKKAADAVKEAKALVADAPQSVTGHYLRGMALAETGDSAEAIKAFQDVLRLAPATVPALVKIATLYLNQNEAAAAADVLGQAIKLQPDSVLAHFLLSRAMLQVGNVDGAEKDVMKLVALAPNSAETQSLLGDLYWLKHDYARAKSSYLKAAQVQSDSLDALKGLIRVDIAQKAPDAARARIEARLAKNPNDTTLLLLAGAVLTEAGDQRGAESMYMRILQNDPSNMDAYNNLGALYLAQNRLEEAKKQYIDAARKQPKTAVAATTMVGIILTLQSKPGEARQQYQQAIALDPQAAVAANNLAWDYAENGGATLDVALTLAQTAKARLPGRWEASDTLGWIYYKKGLTTLAVTAFRQGVEQNPSNPLVQYHLGLAHLKNGDRVGARNALQRALSLDPKFASAEDAKRVLATIKG